MLGIGCYLTGLALWCSAACTAATVMLALGLALDCGVPTLLLSALRFSIASGARDKAAESCVILHSKYLLGGLRTALYVSSPLPLERVVVSCRIMSGA